MRMPSNVHRSRSITIIIFVSQQNNVKKTKTSSSAMMPSAEERAEAREEIDGNSICFRLTPDYTNQQFDMKNIAKKRNIVKSLINLIIERCDRCSRNVLVAIATHTYQIVIKKQINCGRGKSIGNK